MKRLIPGLLFLFVCVFSWSAEPFVQDGFVCIPIENYKQHLMEQELLKQNFLKLNLRLEILLTGTSKLILNTEESLLISANSEQIEQNVMQRIEKIKVLQNDNSESLQNALTLTKSASEDLKEVEDTLTEIQSNVWIERISIGATCLVIGFIIGYLTSAG